MSTSLNFSLGDYLLLLEKRLLGGVIGLQHLLDIQKLCQTIPGQTSAFFGFEIPMAEEHSDADFLFCSTLDEGHASVLSGSHHNISMPECHFDLPAWQKVREFCQTWEDPSSALYNRLMNIWLEFDVGQSAAPHSPSFFFGTPSTLHAGKPAVRKRLNGLIFTALEQVSTTATKGKRAEMLQTVLDAVPPSAHVFQVGVMLSRELPGVRVCIRDLQPSQLEGFLAAINWTGSKQVLSEVLARYADSCAAIALDIDVGETVWDKIGLECSFANNPDPLLLMKKFCNLCVTDEITSAAKAQGLIAYNGLILQDEAPDLWPAHLHKTAALRGRNFTNYLSCWIHHIKLVVATDTPLSAKAYLAVEPGQADRSDLKKRLQALTTHLQQNTPLAQPIITQTGKAGPKVSGQA